MREAVLVGEADQHGIARVARAAARAVAGELLVAKIRALVAGEGDVDGIHGDQGRQQRLVRVDDVAGLDQRDAGAAREGRGDAREAEVELGAREAGIRGEQVGVGLLRLHAPRVEFALRHCARGDQLLGAGEFLLRQRDARLEGAYGGLGFVDLGPADDLLLHELRAPLERELRLAEPGLVLGRAALRRRELRPGDVERRADLRIVEPREDLPPAHGLAFLHVHFEHLARDLRRDGGPAPRGHVAGRVQHRPGGCPGPAGFGDDGRRPHLGGLRARSREARSRAGGEHDDDRENPGARAAAAGARISIYLERGEVVFER